MVGDKKHSLAVVASRDMEGVQQCCSGAPTKGFRFLLRRKNTTTQIAHLALIAESIRASLSTH